MISESPDPAASLQEAAISLAYAIDAPAPPPELRSRILTAARAERPNVVPLFTAETV